MNILGISPQLCAKSALVFLAALGFAQTLSPGEVRINSRPYQLGATFRSESRLVQIEVVVRDKRGLPVSGLTKDEFSVYDSGKRIDLSGFSVEVSSVPAKLSASASKPPSDEEPAGAVHSESQKPVLNPRFIAVFFDDINTNTADLSRAKVAARRFIKEAASEGDMLGIFTTAAGQVLDFTGDTQKALDTIAAIESRPRASPAGLASCPRITPYEAYRIVNNDPMALQAKVEEACHCNGQACSASSIPPAELLGSASRAASSGGVLSGVSVGQLVDSVRAQADQTWNQTRIISEQTLEAIGASIGKLREMSGKRILLLTSSGFLSGDLEAKEDTVINEALRAGVVINSLDSKGLYAEAPGRPLSESVEVTELTIPSLLYEARTLGDRLDSLDAAMARFAESTGGLLFRNNNDLDLGFYQLGILPSATYMLAFPPTQDGKYHKVKVDLKKGNRDFIQARPGYFAPGSEQLLTADDKIEAAVRSLQDVDNLPATVSEKSDAAGTGGRRLMVQTHVDLKSLPFVAQKDRHLEKLTFVAVIFDSKGNFVAGKRADMDLALKSDSFERLQKTGINGLLPFDIPPGTYRLRTVIREATHGNLSATSKPVQVE